MSHPFRSWTFVGLAVCAGCATDSMLADAGAGPPRESRRDAANDPVEVIPDAAVPVDAGTAVDAAPDAAPCEGCCRSDDDCAAADACHVGRCDLESGECLPVAVPDCCLDDAACASEDPCQRGTCDPATRRCRIEPAPECCREDADCPAGAPCSTARCDTEAHRCVVEPVAECCVEDADCPAAPCGAPICLPDGGRCDVEPIAGCCVADDECPGGERCDREAQACTAEPADADADGWTSDQDCDDADPARNPGLPEACADAIDNDCDGDVDQGDADCAGASEIAYAAVQFPLAPVPVCVGEPTPLIFGRVFAPGVTSGEGAGAGITAELGYGPPGSDPAESPDWRWTAGAYNGDLQNDFHQLADDEYRAALVDVPAGRWHAAWRFRLDDGGWVFADRRPGGSVDGYAPATALVLEAREPEPGGGCAEVLRLFAATQFPVEPVEICGQAPAPEIYGRVYAEGHTEGQGPGDGIEGALGFGPAGSDPAGEGWTWVGGRYHRDLHNALGEDADDEYRATPLAVPVGAWEVVWRFRLQNGGWVHGDLGPAGSDDGYDPATALSLTVRADCQ